MQLKVDNGGKYAENLMKVHIIELQYINRMAMALSRDIRFFNKKIK